MRVMCQTSFAEEEWRMSYDAFLVTRNPELASVAAGNSVEIVFSGLVVASYFSTRFISENQLYLDGNYELSPKTW